MAYNHAYYGNTMPTQPTTTTNSHSRRASRSSTTQSNHSYRVEKPRSTHNSPLVLERRKTTTGGKLYATLDDHYRMMMGIVDDDEMVDDYFQPTSTRPVSWHPTSSHSRFAWQHQDQYQPQNLNRHSSSSSGRNSVSGSDFYSLSARNSSFLEPTPDHTSMVNASQSHGGLHDSNASHLSQLNSSSYSTPSTQLMPWYLQEWARKNREQVRNASNESSDCLPTQYPSSTQDTNNPQYEETVEDSGKELIGMGLYDLPDSTTGLGSLVEATGKGLKLEETWQPPEENDDDQNDDDQEDDSSDDCEEELPPSPSAQQESHPLQVPCNTKPQLPTGMPGQNFLFDEDAMATKEWWYHQFKQQPMPVRETGIGYGWL